MPLVADELVCADAEGLSRIAGTADNINNPKAREMQFPALDIMRQSHFGIYGLENVVRESSGGIMICIVLTARLKRAL